MLIHFVVGEKHAVSSEFCSSGGRAAVQRNARLVAHVLNVTVPFRPDSKASHICGIFHGLCNSYSSRRSGAFPGTCAHGVALVDGTGGKNKLSGGRWRCLLAGAAKLRADLMWKHQERRGLGTRRHQRRL